MIAVEMYLFYVTVKFLMKHLQTFLNLLEHLPVPPFEYHCNGCSMVNIMPDTIYWSVTRSNFDQTGRKTSLEFPVNNQCISHLPMKSEIPRVVSE